MNSQTARGPSSPRSTRPTKSNKTKQHYSRQTAHVEARRDGKPLIFGWGGHLSHTAKVRLRRQATWGMTILFALLIVIVLVGFWLNINVIVPGESITSVNGHAIPQSQYRKMVALEAQIEENKIYGPQGLFAQRTTLQQQVSAQQKIINDNVTITDNLNKQITKLHAGPSTQRTQLTQQLAAAKKVLNGAQTQHDKLNAQLNNLTTNTIPQEQQLYVQSQVGNDSIGWLQDDELIREWLDTQSNAVRAQVTPSAQQITAAMNNFKANLPKTGPQTTTYSQLLSTDGVSDDDMQAAMTVIVRRNNMQTYLAAKTVSPAYQVLARTMTLSTQKDAQSILDQLHKGGDFAKLAKAKSVDTSTNTKGGSLDWMARGQYASQEGQAFVENWLFAPGRYINQISPIINENGAFHIVQILGIDPSRTVDSATLTQLKASARDNWLLTQRALPTTSVTAVDQNKLTDPANMPTALPSSAPSQSTPTTNPSVPGSGVPTGP